MRRGQVTLFVIAAVFVAVAIILFFTFNTENQQINNPELADFVEGCLYDVSYNSLETIRIQGGYYNVPQKSFDPWGYEIPYYYYEGEFLMPTNEIIESELSEVINNALAACFNEYSGSYTIETAGISSESSIQEGEVFIEVDTNLVFQKENEVITIATKDMPVNIPSPLFNMIEVANYITESHREDPKNYCINCLDEIAKQNGVFVYNFELEENNVLVVITENTSINAKSFEFMNRYTGNEVPANYNEENNVPGVFDE